MLTMRNITPDRRLEIERDTETRSRFFYAFDHKDDAQNCPNNFSVVVEVSAEA